MIILQYRKSLKSGNGDVLAAASDLDEKIWSLHLHISVDASSLCMDFASYAVGFGPYYEINFTKSCYWVSGSPR